MMRTLSNRTPSPCRTPFSTPTAALPARETLGSHRQGPQNWSPKYPQGRSLRCLLNRHTSARSCLLGGCPHPQPSLPTPPKGQGKEDTSQVRKMQPPFRQPASPPLQARDAELWLDSPMNRASPAPNMAPAPGLPDSPRARLQAAVLKTLNPSGSQLSALTPPHHSRVPVPQERSPQQAPGTGPLRALRFCREASKNSRASWARCKL